MIWQPPTRFAELTEKRIIAAILEERFPIGANLPAERELAVQLGVTRPTLREALQRLARDGWLDIQQGKATRVRNYWDEGNLGVLAAVADYHQSLPSGFVDNLLQVRLLLAPAYTRLAIEHHPAEIARFLYPYQDLPETAAVFSFADWELHHTLTRHSENPIYTLILNGFRTLYPAMGEIYFSLAETRRASRVFYQHILTCAEEKDLDGAEQETRRVMEASIRYWKTATKKQPS